ncbi:3-oxoadipyl-CoA thiolase [Rufibacter psychrotolerans]|uniref:3-oxoadipyl-CoA thiolase n=1 Tax=Rufibacter psychrotolerans TaxID=2812556 RepID=UPI0019683C8F|nr:3-oxoadipyl-CoA thiolase [Rufibacter sp. SYSU D00308]
MNQAYIVDGIRTPIGNLGGALAPVRPDDMAAQVIRELMRRNPSADPAAVADVLLGCANQAGEDNRNVARMSLLLAGLPFEVPGETVNRLCASGLTAAVAAARAIQCGDGDLFIAGGVESMTRAPWVISKASTPFGRDAQMFDSSFGWRFVNPKLHELFGTDGMGETAENLARREGITREDQDAFAVWSQQKAYQAQQSGRLAEEIIPVTIPQKKGDPNVISEDEFLKPATSLEGLAKLKPAFHKEGTVTAGNASGLNDGAAALLLSSEEGLKKYNLTPKARYVSMGVSGVEPKYMGFGPVPATQQALKRAGLTLNDIDLIEINEAFASQVLACTRGLGLEDQDSRINPNGGAIALGHPLGMSGARILNSAAIELHKQNKRYALITMCVGVGQGYAAIIERV